MKNISQSRGKSRNPNHGLGKQIGYRPQHPSLAPIGPHSFMQTPFPFDNSQNSFSDVGPPGGWPTWSGGSCGPGQSQPSSTFETEQAVNNANKTEQMCMRYPVWRSLAGPESSHPPPFNECAINIPEGYSCPQFGPENSLPSSFSARCQPPYTSVPQKLYDCAMYSRLYGELHNPYHFQNEEKTEKNKKVCKENEKLNAEDSSSSKPTSESEAKNSEILNKKPKQGKINSLYDCIDFSDAQLGVNYQTIREQLKGNSQPSQINQFDFSSPGDDSEEEDDNEEKRNKTNKNNVEKNVDKRQTEQQQGTNTKNSRKLKRFAISRKLPYASVLPTFDYHLVPLALEFSTQESDSATFEEQLEERCQYRLSDLTPTTEEYSSVAELLLKVDIVLNKLKTPGCCDAVKIDSIDQVGSFRMGTTLRGTRNAQIVLTLRSLPVKAALQALGNRLADELSKLDDGRALRAEGPRSESMPPPYYHVQLREDAYLEVEKWYLCTKSSSTLVQVHFTILPELVGKLEPKVHLPVALLARNRLLVLQAAWFEAEEQRIKSQIEAMSKPEVEGRTISSAGNQEPQQSQQQQAQQLPGLIRLLSDLVRRFPDHFSSLTPWMIVVLSHYAITENPRYQEQQQKPKTKQVSPFLSMGVALRRLLQLFSAGLVLPYSTGISDPLEGAFLAENENGSGPRRPLHARLSARSLESITRAAQTLLRVMTLEGGLNYLLGLWPQPSVMLVGGSKENQRNTFLSSSGSNEEVLTRTTEWKGGVIVKPLKCLFTNKNDANCFEGEERGDDDNLGGYHFFNDNVDFENEFKYSTTDNPNDYDLAVFENLVLNRDAKEAQREMVLNQNVFDERDKMKAKSKRKLSC